MIQHIRALLTVIAAGIMLLAAFFYWRELSENEVPQRQIPEIVGYELKNIAGETFKVPTGKVVVVNFWASWCAPCVEEIPSMVKLVNAMSGSLSIVAISGDSALDEVTIFLKSFPDFSGPHIQVVWDENWTLSRSFGVGRLPESYIYDSKGSFVRKVVGSIDWSTPEAIEFMKSLIRE